MGNSLAVSYKTKHALTICHPEIALLGMYPRGMKTYIHSKAVATLCSQEMFIATLFSIVQIGNNPNVFHQWVRKQTVVYPHFQILYSNKKDHYIEKCKNTVGSQMNYAAWKQPSQKVMYCMNLFVYYSWNNKIWWHGSTHRIKLYHTHTWKSAKLMKTE